MSGKPTGPQAPKMFKQGKFKLTMALEPRVEEPQAAQLTVIPSGGEAKAEDKGPQPKYTSVAARPGMFKSVSAKPSAGPSGITTAEKPKKAEETGVARPLALNMGDDERVLQEEEEALPPPPPAKAQRLAPEVQERPLVLPSVGKELLRLTTKPGAKSYAEAAVKSRINESMAKTLKELDTQLRILKGKGVDLDTETGVTKATADGKTTYTLSKPLEPTADLSDEKLTALDDLFRTMQIRMTTFRGEGSIEAGSTSQFAKDFLLLKKLFSFAAKYKEEVAKREEREKEEALLDMMTPDVVQTLLDLEAKLTTLNKAGITFDSMEMEFPDKETDPYVYTFTDGTTFLDVLGTPEAKAAGEARLAKVSALFPNKSKITLTQLVGRGALDEDSDLQKDVQFLSKLFGLAHKVKVEEEVSREIGEEAARLEDESVTKTLEGTPYEALAKPIDAEMTKSPYEVTTESKYKPGAYPDKTGREVTIPEQKGFIPQTRRAFGYFIRDKYRGYMLKALKELDANACKTLGSSSNLAQIYEYQKFVRDYISFMTPYRGVLVYHGLGSGKTCTAIAASEALLASGGKKRIIVMTPFSLRKNFIQQITFCGFRHFRLENYWTSQTYNRSDGKNALWLFATSVLHIPDSYLTAKRGSINIWIPDLNRNESNYSTLSATQQAEIRNQIYESLIYDPDPKKNKNGLIWFLNYNGISASKLRDIACRTPDAFDNSVIVVDEIHNLIRLMQGTIDSYLRKMFLGQQTANSKGDPKYLDPERITSEKWKPKLCTGNLNYKRGYLFYRLLLQVTNSKIIGLSGTPLINFPEELGILANILHGYNFLYTAKIGKVNDAGGNERIVEGLKKMADGSDATFFSPYIDFFEVNIEDRQMAILFTFTLLPEGYRKIQGQLGVERIPFSDPIPSVKERLADVMQNIDKIMKSVKPIYTFIKPGVEPEQHFVERAEPLLPVMGEPSLPEQPILDDSFKGRFVKEDGVSIKNPQILMKRLSGLISYYKGSRKDLMPEVKPEDDVVVRVPMSLEQQKKYIAVRVGEIAIEKQKETARGAPAEVAGPRGDEAEIKKLASSQNYRMASRQACNFTFPDGFTRPRPLSAKEAKEANELGGNVEELLGEEQATEPSALVRTAEEERAQAEKDKQEAAQAERDDEATSEALEKKEIEEKREELRGRPEGEIAAAIDAIRQRYQMEREAGILVAGDKEKEQLSAELSPEQKRCLANKISDTETYQMAINRSKECLLKYALPKLALTDPARPEQSPLAKCSTKYKAMLENIEAIPGSSLVYSQFLSMEGIGIFTIVLQANGFVPIKIISRDGQYTFDEQTEASIRKGPGARENRFILFTGGEDEDVRKVNIDLFNAKFSELPPRINSILQESGFTDEIGNKRGELCRVFCITAAGAEGLSLKNVRGVHIMEPYWNDVRMAQVKGRAVRICSHQDLPLKDRNVKIYTYISVYDRMAQEANPEDGTNPWAIDLQIWQRDILDRATAESFGLTIASTKGEYAMTSDERLYFISERKKQLVENLIIVMKTAAADCLLNYSENRDGTFICRLLGNEGDFLYHPNLQRDIETSRDDDIGNIFVVPEAEKQRIKAADESLRFKEEQEETKEESKEGDEAQTEAPKVAIEKKTYTYPVKIGQKPYKVIGETDETGVVPLFLVFNDKGKRVGEAVAQKTTDPKTGKEIYIPKKGTVVFK